MEIRVLTRDDALAFSRLRLQALAIDPYAFSASPEEHRELPLEKFAERLSSTPPGDFVMGAFDAGELVGTVGFFREKRDKTNHKGHLWAVFVRPDHRGAGLGRDLLLATIQTARFQPGLEQVLLTVTCDQTSAKRLYASAGFEVFGHEPRAMKVGSQRVDQDHMVLRLA